MYIFWNVFNRNFERNYTQEMDKKLTKKFYNNGLHKHKIESEISLYKLIPNLCM